MITLGEYTGYRGPPQCRKIPHLSWEAASHQLDSMRGRMRAPLRDPDTLRIYQCPECGYWHVGHYRKGEQQW